MKFKLFLSPLLAIASFFLATVASARIITTESPDKSDLSFDGGKIELDLEPENLTEEEVERIVIDTAAEETKTLSDNESNFLEIEPSFGNVPGIYYDDSGYVSPSLTEMEGTDESGSIGGYEDPDEEYNTQRAWQRGSTPDKIVKVGDLVNDPELASFIEIDTLTLREIAENGGADIQRAPLKSIGLINSMSLEQFLAVFPELKNTEIENVPLILESIQQIDGVLERVKGIEERVLSQAQQKIIEKYANDPRFENIPLDALVTGDWGELVESEQQAILAEVMAKYPELEKVPIDKLFPVVEGAISGDWSLVVEQAKEYAVARGTKILTRQLIEAIPQLADVPLGALPIDALKVGDLDGLADATLDRIPGIANRYISELGNLSQTPGTMFAIDTATVLLTGDIFGRLDIPFAGDVETPITYVLTGGTRNQVFLPEPCLETSCKHFEITDVLSGIGGAGNVQGKAWVQGSSQKVPGGKGFLRFVNGGQERTGVPVWTTDAHVKISLEDLDEGGGGEPATARIWLDFQVCVYPPFLGEHCTPHIFSFATPWKVKEGGLMLVFSRSSPSDVIEYARENSQPPPDDESGGGKIDNNSEI